nr:PREDICTED: ninja-family protein AFP3-like [Daucus carota subsp. sativus]
MVYPVNSFVSPPSMRPHEEKVVKEREEEENIDLSLSLSLNGKFGVDPQRNQRTNSCPEVLITPNQRSSPISDDNGGESKMRQPPDSQGSNSSYFQCQTIKGQGYPANIRSSNGVRNVAGNTPPKAIPAARGKVNGIVFNNTGMPCVFTTVHGQKIEGFLSRYNDEDDVIIICACHGDSMTPSEFIKHAGGGDVAYPLRDIKMIKRSIYNSV